MDERFGGKLNQLEKDLPEGLLVDAAWLEKKGYYGSQRKQYVDRGWLEQPAHRVYRRMRGQLRWEQVIISLQTLLEQPVVVGGRTALELQGFAHYLSQEQKEVHLYGQQSLPTWLNKLPLSQKFVFHRTGHLFHDDPITRGLGSVAWNLQTGVGASTDQIHGQFNAMPWGQWDWPLTVTVPERAILELLDELPNKESFHQADMLMEGLATLSPRRLEKLLLDCKSIKVKRLFFFFADRHQHRWLAKIDQSKINLGSGKRMLVRGGKLDTKYQITVPEEFHAVQ